MTERQRLFNLLPTTVMLWPDWRRTQMDRDIRNTIVDIVALPAFQHLKGCLSIDDRLNSKSCVAIHEEISKFLLFEATLIFLASYMKRLQTKI